MRWKLLLMAVVAPWLTSCLTTPTSRAAETSPAAALKDGIIARAHFAGTTAISAEPGAGLWDTIGAMPETAALRQQLISKLATAPYREYSSHTASTNEFASLFAPLADDLTRNEWFAEAHESTNAWPEILLAVRLDAGRAEAWEKDLSTILSGWTGIQTASFSTGGFSGWELKKHESPNLLKLVRAGDWVVLDAGDDNLALLSAALQRIKDTQRPVDAAKDYWLDAAADWPALAGHHLAPASVSLPRMRLVVQGRKTDDGKDIVRPELTMQFPRPLGLTLQPWRIPTNLIHSPMTSFTAMRGLASRLADSALIKSLNAEPLPDQLFIWANEGIPVDTSWAALVDRGDATNYLDRIAPPVVATMNNVLNGHQINMGATTTNHQLSTWGLPFVSPYMRASRGPTGEYLIGGLMPSPGRVAPIPSALVNELNSHPNLAYYSWEYTALRVNQTRPILQLYTVVAGEVLAVGEGASANWLNTAGPKLGNSGTEVTLTAPNELTLVRNSPFGLTAWEITMFLYWADAPDFPLGIVHPARPGMTRTSPLR